MKAKILVHLPLYLASTYINTWPTVCFRGLRVISKKSLSTGALCWYNPFKMSSKGAKSHNQFGTSRIPVPINNFIHGNNELLEMAGIQHNAVSTIVKNDAAAPWNYHYLAYMKT